MVYTRQHIERFLFILALYAYAIASYYIMPAIDNSAEMEAIDTVYPEFFSILMSIPYFMLAFREIFRRNLNKTIILFLLFGIWGIVSTILNYSAKSYIVFAAMPIFPLLMSYTYARKYELDNGICTVFFLSFVLISYRYLQIYQVAHGFFDAIIGVSYFVPIVLPLVLLCPSKVIRIIGWLVTFIVIFSSGKRGGLIAVLASVIIYIFCKQIISNKNKIQSIIIILAALTTLLTCTIYVFNTYGSEIVERMMQLRTDGGSGRLYIWELVIRDLMQSDSLSFINGHGYFSVRLLTADTGLPAHNDFLEIFYDFGLIGIVMYVLTWISLISQFFRMLRAKNKMTPVFAVMLTEFFIFSMVSIVYFYFYIVYICIFIGIIIGQIELAAANQEITNE